MVAGETVAGSVLGRDAGQLADAMDIVEGQGGARMFHRQQVTKLIQHHGGQQHYHAGDHQAATAGGVLLQVEVQIQQAHGEQRDNVERAVVGDGDQVQKCRVGGQMAVKEEENRRIQGKPAAVIGRQEPGQKQRNAQ